MQKNVGRPHNINRAHTTTSNQQDVIVVPEGYRDITNYGKRPQHYVEHIYESPTFARKEYSRDPLESSGKYYELESDTEPSANMSHDKNSKAVVNYPPRLSKPVLPNRVTPPISTDTNTRTNTHLSY